MVTVVLRKPVEVLVKIRQVKSYFVCAKINMLFVKVTSLSVAFKLVLYICKVSVSLSCHAYPI